MAICTVMFDWMLYVKVAYGVLPISINGLNFDGLVSDVNVCLSTVIAKIVCPGVGGKIISAKLIDVLTVRRRPVNSV